MTMPHSSSRLSSALGNLKTLGSQSEAELDRERPKPLAATRSCLTDEQEGALASQAHRLQVKAYAGCGKTRLLREFAARGTKWRTLYLAFNKPIALSAQADFGDTAICKTSHSLALTALMRGSSAWRNTPLEQKIGNPSPGRLTDAFPDLFSPGEISAGAPKICIDAIRSFIASSDSDIFSGHFFRSDAISGEAGKRLSLDPERLVSAARTVWSAMADPANLSIQLPHDGYLKLWSLLEIPIDFDLILIDEAQDSNPALLSALAAQRSRQIYVGDEHQAIYGFRGALNAFSSLNGVETHYLTQSFRLKSRLASLASGVLLLKKAHKPLIGHSAGGLIERRPPLGAQTLFLARSNPGLFERALSMAKQGKRMGFLNSDSSKFSISGLDDLLALRSGRKPQDPIMGAFPSLGALRDAAEEISDSELLLRIRLVEEHGERLPEALRAISRNVEPDLSKASAILSTVHKAKGLEADWCELADDFELTAFHQDKLDYFEDKEAEEANIFYVALTRAKEGVALSDRQSRWARKIEKLLASPATAPVPLEMRGRAEAFLLANGIPQANSERGGRRRGGL